MGVKLDFTKLIGLKYGKLTVVKETERRYHHMVVVECLCDCGNTYFVTMNALKKGNTKSCGCIRKERNNGTTHGLSKHPLFDAWNNIKQRCYNPKFNKYKDYGGRGIMVCDEWLSDFKVFYEWCISNGWQKGLEIDRRENNGNYEPGNCRFLTRKENMNNTRNNQIIEFNGETKTVSQWSDFTGIPLSRLKQRIYKLNMPLDLAFSKEKIKRRFYKVKV